MSWATGPTIAVSNGTIVRSTVEMEVHETTPFQWIGRRVQLSTIGGNITLRCVIDGSISDAPAIPNGTLGTFVTTMVTGATWTATAQLFRISHTAQASPGSPPQSLDYELIVSANTSSNPVTVA